MALKTNSDSQVRDDLTEIKVVLRKVVEPQLQTINERLDNLSFVSQKEYDEDRKDFRESIARIDLFIDTHKQGIKLADLLANRMLQTFVLLLVTAALAAVGLKTLGG